MRTAPLGSLSNTSTYCPVETHTMNPCHSFYCVSPLQKQNSTKFFIFLLPSYTKHFVEYVPVCRTVAYIYQLISGTIKPTCTVRSWPVLSAIISAIPQVMQGQNYS